MSVSVYCLHSHMLSSVPSSASEAYRFKGLRNGFKIKQKREMRKDKV